jgi:hypothetical protein
MYETYIASHRRIFFTELLKRRASLRRTQSDGALIGFEPPSDQRQTHLSGTVSISSRFNLLAYCIT